MPRRREEPLVRRLDVAQGGDERRDALPRAQLDGADRHLVERIGHGEGDALGLVRQRHDLGVAQEIGAQFLLEERQLGQLVGGRDGEAEPRRQRLGHVALRHQAELGEKRQEMVAPRAAQAQRPVEPGRAELAARHQRLADGNLDRLSLGKGGRIRHDGDDKPSPDPSQAVDRSCAHSTTPFGLRSG